MHWRVVGADHLPVFFVAAAGDQEELVVTQIIRALADDNVPVPVPREPIDTPSLYRELHGLGQD